MTSQPSLLMLVRRLLNLQLKGLSSNYFVSSLMTAVSGGIFVVNILKHQHIPELFFSPFWESTALGELRRVLIGTEQTIPKGDIRKIVFVHVVLVMNGVKLGGLDEESKPFGRPDVGMVEVFARGAEEVVPESPHHGTPQQRVQHQRAENGIA